MKEVDVGHVSFFFNPSHSLDKSCIYKELYIKYIGQLFLKKLWPFVIYIEKKKLEKYIPLFVQAFSKYHIRVFTLQQISLHKW